MAAYLVGYVTWATAGDLGQDLLELCMIIDHKQIDLNYPRCSWSTKSQIPIGLAGVAEAA